MDIMDEFKEFMEDLAEDLSKKHDNLGLLPQSYWLTARGQIMLLSEPLDVNDAHINNISNWLVKGDAYFTTDKIIVDTIIKYRRDPENFIISDYQRSLFVTHPVKMFGQPSFSKDNNCSGKLVIGRHKLPKNFQEAIDIKIQQIAFKKVNQSYHL
jgi:hypothetical protein